MGVFTDPAKTIMLDAIANGTAPSSHITHVSAHTAYPPTTANQIGSRVAIDWPTASGASVDDSTNGADLAIPAGTTVAAEGYWDAATAGNLLGQHDLGVDAETFTNDGTYRVTTAVLSINDPA